MAISDLESPVLGVKRTLFRMHDPAREEADEAFRTIRKSVLARDKNTCRFCRMATAPSEARPSGYFQVHHLDNNHKNNTMGNLATVCPFCHQVFHAGMAGHGKEPGLAIFLPELGQWELNRLCHVIFAVLSSKSEDLSEEKTKAERLYHELQERNKTLKDVFGPEAASLASLAKAIARLPEALYVKRDIALADVRILPIRGAFIPETEYWSELLLKKIPVRLWDGILDAKIAQKKD